MGGRGTGSCGPAGATDEVSGPGWEQWGRGGQWTPGSPSQQIGWGEDDRDSEGRCLRFSPGFSFR